VLEFVGVERRKDVAEVIVRGGCIAKRPEPTHKIELLLAEPVMSTKVSVPASTAGRLNSSSPASG
jgi:hypothetical protein